MKIEKQITTYTAQLSLSEWDKLEIEQDGDGRITIKFLESRWRTIEETKKLLQEIIDNIDTLPKVKDND